MKKQIIALCLFIYLLFPQATFAARSIIVSTDKTSLFGEEEINLSASMSGFTDGETIYLKGAFFKEGSTNYFGYTKNGDSWIKNSMTAVEQRAVQIGSFDGLVTAKSDFSDSGYSGTGSYSLKLGFYYITSGGNVSSVNWSSNILSVNLDQPVPTPTPTESKSNQQESVTPVVSQITKAPTPVKTSSPKTTPVITKKFISPTQAIISYNSGKISNEKQSSRSVALEIKDPSFKKSEDVKVLGAKDNKFSALFVLGGLFLLISGASWFGLKIMKEKGLYEKIFNK